MYSSKKENLIDIGGYDEEFNYKDGYYLWIRFIKNIQLGMLIFLYFIIGNIAIV